MEKSDTNIISLNSQTAEAVSRRMSDAGREESVLDSLTWPRPVDTKYRKVWFQPSIPLTGLVESGRVSMRPVEMNICRRWRCKDIKTVKE